VITALQPRADLPAHPRASLEAGGIMLLERNVRLLRQAGAQTVYILTDDQFAVLAPLVSTLGKAQDIKLIDNAIELTNALSDDDNILVLDEGVLLDERLIIAVATDDAPCVIAVFPSLAPEHERAVRIDPEFSFASVLKAPGKMVRDVCRGLGDWDFVHTLLRGVAAQPDITMLPVSQVDTYVDDLRRQLPIIWQPMRSAADQPVALERLLEAAQPHVLDWPARFIHPLLESSLARLVLPTAVGAPLVIFTATLLGLIAAGCFATGWLWPGLLLIILASPLEGLAAKLSRIRVEQGLMQRFGSGLSLMTELACYAGLAWYFSMKLALSAAWPMLLLVSLSRLAAMAQQHFHYRFTGRPLDDAGPLDRKIRLFASHKHTHFWAMLPFAATNLWWVGYKFIAFCAVLTFFLAQLRSFIWLKKFGVAACPAAAANFERTDNGVLRWRKTGIR
jgi:1L-myo-inositol 1-phosphate cytidylyltransferase / CDP-L-myo-inositol myo-inositolphosphotransferase